MELYQKTAAELSAMLKNKEVSSVELTKAAFARTAAVEDKVGAYITLTEEHALETAAAIDAKRAAGEELAPLAGVPVSVKDNILHQGHSHHLCFPYAGKLPAAIRCNGDEPPARCRSGYDGQDQSGRVCNGLFL